MRVTDLSGWLAAYGRAWEQKDTDAFVSLFTPDVRYHWTPFEEPRTGRGAVAEAFDTAVARQSDIRFDASILNQAGRTGIVHWRCSLTRTGGEYRVRFDGIFVVELTDEGLCQVFREWWHTDELAQQPEGRSPGG